MPQIVINHQTYTYRLSQTRRRTLALKPTTRRSFAVYAPLHTPSLLITRFINSHADWIVKACASLPQTTKLSSQKSLTILGQKYDLVYIKTTRDALIIDHGSFQIIVNAPSFSTPHLKQLFNLKLRPLALKLIKSQLEIYRSQFGFSFGRVSVKNQSTRFGSCSSIGNLNFNWQIIFLPTPLFNHVLLHELTHLNIKNHSSTFWTQLSHYDPHTAVHRRLLRSRGLSYFLIKS